MPRTPLNLCFIVFIVSLSQAAPLTIHDQQNLGGIGTDISQTYTIYEDGSIPGGLNNAISSFRLNAGYMVVVGDLSDLSTSSKTFIAETQDLTVNTLPAELDNKISFIRLMPWKASTKKGTGGDLAGQPSVGAGWYYNWGYNVTRGSTNDALGREYIPMCWGGGTTDRSSTDTMREMTSVTTLLAFNEPDDCNGQSGQYNNLCDVPTAAGTVPFAPRPELGYYKGLQRVGLRMGSPAPREGGASNETSWLSQFIDECEAANLRIDFAALHWYDWGSNPTETIGASAEVIFGRFKRYLSNAYHMYRMPIWLTEFNANINRPTATHDAFLQLALPYLESIGYIERYAYFQPNSGEGNFFNNGQLTTTGQIYRDHESTPSYSSEILPAQWATMDIGTVSQAGVALYNFGSERFTVCGTGAGVRNNQDAFRFVYQPVSEDVTIVARLEAFLEYDTISKVGVMVRDELTAGSKYAFASITGAGEAMLQRRTVAWNSTAKNSINGASAPGWLRLERSGDLFTASYSEDGATWTQIASQTVAMEADVYVGLAVSSYTDGEFADAVFTNVAVGDDLTAPEPNAAAFHIAPFPNSQSSITMTAVEGVDANGPVEYFFTETSGNAGGDDSGWQKSPTYIDNGLTPNTQYSYTVKMRDSLLNTGAPSSAYTAFTFVGSLLTSDDFEAGFGNWVSGGSDAFLSSENALGSQGVNLQGGSGAESSLSLANVLDLTSYRSVEVAFTFYVVGMVAGEGFSVQFSNDGGSSWHTGQSFTSGTDFTNGLREYAATVVKDFDLEFTSNVKIRIRSEGSEDGGDVFIDDIAITGLNSAATNADPAFVTSPLQASSPTVGSFFSYDLSRYANDSDGDPLSFSMLSGPAWLSFATSGQISGLPSADEVGGHSLSVRVADNRGGESFATVNVYVHDTDTPKTLIGGSLRNGDFNAVQGGSQNFLSTPNWYNLGGEQSDEATKDNADFDGTQNAVIKSSAILGIDSGHVIEEGDAFDISFVWVDGWQWVDATDQINIALFVTDDDAITGIRDDVFSQNAAVSTVNNTYEAVDWNGVYSATNEVAGKTLFAAITGITNNGFARLDNFELIVTPALTDADGDLMKDVWEFNTFGSLTAATSISNADGDLYLDWEEYVMGTNPLDSQSYFSKTLSSVGNGVIEITFYAFAGRTYTLEVSESLIPGDWVSVSTVSPVADGQHTLSYTHAGNPDKLFGRISIVK